MDISPVEGALVLLLTGLATKFVPAATAWLRRKPKVELAKLIIDEIETQKLSPPDNWKEQVDNLAKALNDLSHKVEMNASNADNHFKHLDSCIDNVKEETKTVVSSLGKLLVHFGLN